jgi:CRP/FNR family nitrogen fixation transcriptional regulator
MLAVTVSMLVPAAASAIFETSDRASVADPVWPRAVAQLVARDGALFAEGDPARSWYRLLSGSMRVFRVLRDGRRHISEFVFPGQFFGFESGPAHIQGAEAIEPASVAVYSCERIEQRVAQEPAARQAIRALLMERLAAAQERVMTLGRLNASGRLAAFLLVMARRTAESDERNSARVAALPMGRIDIADYLGLTVETVSRLFTALRCRGAIRLATAHRVEILDPAALELASGGTVDAARADDEAELHCA